MAAIDQTSKPVRLVSLDAYRGFVMLLLLGEALRFCKVSAALPQSAFWRFLCHHENHVAWAGCSLHDLIQPSFSFLVGAALSFSIANRIARGQTHSKMLAHAAVRAVILILLGVYLDSPLNGAANLDFENTLAQIGLGYFFLFLLAERSVRMQWTAFVLILFGYWLAFMLYPVPDHWAKNHNLASAFDAWFLNLFPSFQPFRDNSGGYTTLSFIPTLGTMILGLIAGNVLRGPRLPWAKVQWFVIAGIAGLAFGQTLEWLGICPVVKRIWTPAWVMYSGGWCFLLLAGFYKAIEILEFKRWAFPLKVIGMNSIGAYCLADVNVNFLIRRVKAASFDTSVWPYQPVVAGAAVIFLFWLILYAMYRKKIFLRI